MTPYMNPKKIDPYNRHKVCITNYRTFTHKNKMPTIETNTFMQSVFCLLKIFVIQVDNKTSEDDIITILPYEGYKTKDNNIVYTKYSIAHKYMIEINKRDEYKSSFQVASYDDLITYIKHLLTILIKQDEEMNTSINIHLPGIPSYIIDLVSIQRIKNKIKDLENKYIESLGDEEYEEMIEKLEQKIENKVQTFIEPIVEYLESVHINGTWSTSSTDPDYFGEYDE